ncbi:hypothetical protein GCM10022377_18150 [Zhihengliuella alba]|uniref:GP-PDE domain-containing protein n=2 Tax=Zhihengliuella alba TaxID=547018 RepID=A0ABP7DK81_9MICC
MKHPMTRTLTAAATGAVVLLAGAAGAHAADAGPSAGLPEREQPVLIGHRGAAGTAPENTVAAFKDGRASGADFFEIDVQLSADGVPFLFHDNTPARTTNAAEVFPGREDDPITSFTWDELQQLDVGSYFSAKYAGERIPHLDDAARIATTQTGVYIEIKSPQNSPGVEAVVADALHGDPGWKKLVAAGKVEVLGFDAASNARFAELAPEIPLQQLAGTVPGEAELERLAGFVDSVGTNYRTLDQAAVDRVQAAGLEVGVYTVNAVDEMERALALGVERITGDFPIQLERYLDGRDPFPGGRGVSIQGAVNDAPGSDTQDQHGEHVVIVNEGAAPVDVSGYYLRDAANNVLSIGEGYVLEPGETLRVYSASGTDADDAYYNHGGAVLNNGGDSLGLWSAEGRLLDTFGN